MQTMHPDFEKAIVYQLKEELNEIWEQEGQETTEALLMDWIVLRILGLHETTYASVG